jgi:amino acid adenylation domain-containing protein
MTQDSNGVAARRAELERRLASLSPAKRALLDKAGALDGAPASEATAALASRNADVPVPMSFAQELLWRLELASPGHSYNVPRTARLHGPLDMHALQRALDALLARHEALRTTFDVVGGEPRQIVHPPRSVPIATFDLHAIAAAERVVEAERRVRELTRRPFDLARDLQLRASVVRLADDDHVLLLESHHVVSDTVSRGILLRDLAALYNEFRGGAPAALAPLAVHYGDFAIWQREQLAGERLETLLAYWRAQLAGAPPLELPTDRPRSAAPSFDGAVRSSVFPPELTESLRRLSQANGTTMFMTLLAAFNVLLARYSGQDDVMVGSPIAGRTNADYEQVIGYFLNTLVLRTSLEGDPTFAGLLARVRETALGAFEHQDVPYEKLVMELRDAGRVAQDPLFNVLFAMQDPERKSMQLAGTTFVPFGADRGATKFDLFLSMAETANGLRAAIEYRTDLFDATTIERMLGHLGALLAAAAATPNERVSRLPILGDAERARLLVEWNATALDYPKDSTLVELVREQAVRTPGAPAVEFDGVSISYGELEVRADALASQLRARGVGLEEVVALYVERSIEMVVAMLAIHRAGGAYLPLDPAYPQDRIEFMLADSHAKVVVTEQSLVSRLPALGFEVVIVDAALEPRPTPEKSNAPAIAPDPERLAYLIYTSGSTGKPKGVGVTHRNVVNFLAGFGAVVPMGPTDTLVAVTPLSFDIAGLEIFLPLTTGARVVVASRETALNPIELAALLASTRATHLQATPVTWRMLVESGWPGQRSLVALCGGEALPPALASALLARGQELWNLYGPTEATIWATMHHVTLAGDGQSTAGAVPIGRPMANVQAYVLDAAGEPAPIGVPGELLLGGTGIARGYHDRPELTADRFIADPFRARAAGEPAPRLYRTGDRARRLPDGVIEFLGRFDQQIKLRGHRIELGEIEHAIAAQPGVGAAVAIVREDTPGDARLVAYVVPSEEAAESETEVIVDRWRTVWDEAYKQPDASGEVAQEPEPGFNTAGWVSSYDLNPIAAPEMREWLDRTAERMLAGNPRRILDVGCGTGLYLFRMAPHCDAYVGVDASGEALRAIARDPAMASLHNVTLHEALAHQLSETFQPASFDLVVLNSVVQYFPNVEYLVDVMRQAAALVAPGGTLFVGDVRDVGLLEPFHESVALAHASSELSLPELRARVQARMAKETELIIDPAFFAAVQQQIPAIRECAVLPKRGHAANELTKYRYDVAMHVAGGAGDAGAIDIEAIPTREASTLDAVRALIADHPDAIRLTDVLDARLANDVRVHAWLRAATGEAVRDGDLPDGDVPATVGAMRDALLLAPPSGIDVESLFTLDADYDVELRWPASGRLGRTDVVLRHRTRGPISTASSAKLTPARPWSDYVYHAANEIFDPALVSRWRTALGEQLPDYMVPALFVRLERFPLTPNGKIDRKSLRPPASEARAIGAGYLAPRSLVEAQLAETWEEVLQRRPIGVRDDFFDLGGHSLLALRMLARLAERFALRLPLRTLFDSPTIEQLAAHLDGSEGRVSEPTVSDEAIVAREGDEAPLSYGQEVLWLLQRTSPEPGAYHMPDVWRVSGSLDLDALQRTLDRLVERHAALRTTFDARDGAGVQTVTSARQAPLEVLSVEHLAPAERDAAAAALVRERGKLPFDLASDVLLRAVVVHVRDGEQLLSLVTHHIASDGWSRGILLRELSALYDADVRGEALVLPPLRVRYADFAIWQRERLAGPAYERQLRYWTERLSSSTLSVDLPTDRPRTNAPTFVGARKTLVFPTELLARLNRIAQSNDATLYMVLLAAFQTLLHRYSGQEDVVVGTAIAGRARAELDGVVGYFVNTLALNASFHGDPTFVELLARVRDGQLSASENADVPLQQVAQALQRGQGGGPAASCQVMFVLQNNAPSELRLGAATMSGAGMDFGTAKFDLYLSMGEQANGLRASLQYRSDLFDAETIERMLEHLHVLLDGIAAAPRAAVSRLPLMSDGERRIVVETWNATTTAYPRDAFVNELFAAEAVRRPDAIAVECAGSAITYAALAAQANELARHLASLGVREGDRVALCAERSVALVVGMLGILEAGATYVPLEPGYPADRLGFMLADADARVILVQRPLSSVLDAVVNAVSYQAAVAGEQPRVVYLDDQGRLDAMESSRAADAPIASNATRDAGQRAAYVMYTSGSTGKPKGVVVPHRAIVRLVRDTNFITLSEDDVMLGFAPSAFDASTLELWGALLNGGRLVFAPPGLPDLSSLGELVERSGVTTLWLTAALFQQVVDAGLERYHSVRHLLAGGDVLSVPHVRRALAALPDCRLINGYGPTENTTFTCCYAVPHDWPADLPVPIGSPIANTRVYVLDAAGAPTPIGVPGELYAGGDGVATGYLERPELTAEKFVADPFSEAAGGRLYRTGDRVRWLADGTIEFMGRMDQQVKVRGFRVEPGEVEATLAGHPAVRECAVVARAASDGQSQLIGYFVLHNTGGGGGLGAAPLTPASLRAYLRERLPDYMVPVALVPMTALPVGATGKVDRRSLPVPDLSGADAEIPYVAPSTATEERMAAIWADVLGIDRIGVDRSFFDLGGHSLTAMRIMSRVQESFGVRLPLTAVFEKPSIAQISALLDEQAVAVASAPPVVEQAISRVTRTAQRRPAGTSRPGEKS